VGHVTEKLANKEYARSVPEFQANDQTADNIDVLQKAIKHNEPHHG
jgi:hypothetical protein